METVQMFLELTQEDIDTLVILLRENEEFSLADAVEQAPAQARQRKAEDEGVQWWMEQEAKHAQEMS